jgi:hypothetical protein
LKLEGEIPTRERMKWWLQRRIVRLVVKRSQDALAAMPDASLDWAYLDSSHDRVLRAGRAAIERCAHDRILALPDEITPCLVGLCDLRAGRREFSARTQAALTRVP